MKKALVFSLIIIPVLVTALLWTLTSRSCSCLKDTSSVTVTVRKITLSEISLSISTVDVDVQIKNDNAFGATLDKIEYDIYFRYKNKWIWLGKGEKGKLDINANDVANLVITTKIDKRQLIKTLMDSMFGTEPTEMKVDGHAWFTVGPSTIEVDFDEKDIDPYNPLIEDSGTQGNDILE